MCDWCNESIPPTTLVTDISGSLKFCSFLCLNKYKMNLFCMEAQQHLPLQKEMEVKHSFLSDKLLITPDLWLSDVNSGDRRQEESKKVQNPSKDQTFQSKSRSVCNTDSTQKLHNKYLINETDPKPLVNNQSRKRHKIDSTPSFKSSRDIIHKAQQHNHQADHHGLKKTREETPLINNNLLDQDDQQYYTPYPSNLPYFFLPHINHPHTNSTFLFDPLFSKPQNESILKSLSTSPYTSHGNAVQWPLLLPIPIPIPVPIFIQKDIQATSSAFECLSKSPTRNIELNCLNHVIDFSMHKDSRSISVPSQNINQSEPDEHHMTSQILIHKIKIEPEESENLSTNPFKSNRDINTSYADRRSLILDAPPPAKTNQSFGCTQAPRRFSLNKKRCYSVHIKTK